ncbi:hypothetical protein [Actinomycetospora sp. TBRC 11914]|uniref:hypothetical protein n=1 Tax=Actinomycetospora sp. TBRC 11914 TaxID=2729387 RepID=UPI00145DFECD|nr:hypothetical protein [Actinomycetospora sp. TBRC 11914]NMO91738.1 hypothetical protein [Actinomycetospora sp. TBRC 11914]
MPTELPDDLSAVGLPAGVAVPPVRRPLDEALPGTEGVEVQVVGYGTLATQLSASLPAGWSVRAVESATWSSTPGFTLLWRPSRSAVAGALQRRPLGEVVVLLDRRDPGEAVVAAFDAGAAACIHQPAAALVVGYLLRLDANRTRS